MSARDELKRITDEVRDDPARRDMSRIIEREYSQARFEGFGEWGRARLVAHHLHAAGYRLPRTVATVEELDALPNGTVVLSQSYHSGVDGTAVSFQRWYDGDWHRGARSGSTHPDNFLPVTVLHEPEATK